MHLVMCAMALSQLRKGFTFISSFAKMDILTGFLEKKKETKQLGVSGRDHISWSQRARGSQVSVLQAGLASRVQDKWALPSPYHPPSPRTPAAYTKAVMRRRRESTIPNLPFPTICFLKLDF